jgi:hypothetical protein
VFSDPGVKSDLVAAAPASALFFPYLFFCTQTRSLCINWTHSSCLKSSWAMQLRRAEASTEQTPEEEGGGDGGGAREGFFETGLFAGGGATGGI